MRSRYQVGGTPTCSRCGAQRAQKARPPAPGWPGGDARWPSSGYFGTPYADGTCPRSPNADDCTETTCGWARTRGTRCAPVPWGASSGRTLMGFGAIRLAGRRLRRLRGLGKPRAEPAGARCDPETSSLLTPSGTRGVHAQRHHQPPLDGVDGRLTRGPGRQHAQPGPGRRADGAPGRRRRVLIRPRPTPAPSRPASDAGPHGGRLIRDRAAGSWPRRPWIVAEAPRHSRSCGSVHPAPPWIQPGPGPGDAERKRRCSWLRPARPGRPGQRELPGRAGARVPPPVESSPPGNAPVPAPQGQGP